MAAGPAPIVITPLATIPPNININTSVNTSIDITDRIRTIFKDFDSSYTHNEQHAITFVFTILDVLNNAIDQLKDNGIPSISGGIGGIKKEREILLYSLYSHMNTLITVFVPNNSITPRSTHLGYIESCFDYYVQTLSVRDSNSVDPFSVVNRWVSQNRRDIAVNTSVHIAQGNGQPLPPNNASLFVSRDDLDNYKHEIVGFIKQLYKSEANLGGVEYHDNDFTSFNVINTRTQIMGLLGIHIFSLTTLRSILNLSSERDNIILQFLFYLMSDRDDMDTTISELIRNGYNFDRPLLLDKEVNVLVSVDATGTVIDDVFKIFGSLGVRGQIKQVTSIVNELDGAGNNFSLLSNVPRINDTGDRKFTFRTNGYAYLEYEFTKTQFGNQKQGIPSIGLSYFDIQIPNNTIDQGCVRARPVGSRAVTHYGNEYIKLYEVNKKITISSVNRASLACKVPAPDGATDSHYYTETIQFAKKVLDDGKVDELHVLDSRGYFNYTVLSDDEFIQRPELRLFHSIDITPLCRAATYQNIFSFTKAPDNDFTCFLPFHVLEKIFTTVTGFPSQARPYMPAFGKANKTKHIKSVDKDIKYLKSI